MIDQPYEIADAHTHIPFRKKLRKKQLTPLRTFIKLMPGTWARWTFCWKTAGALALAITLSVRLLLLPNSAKH